MADENELAAVIRATGLDSDMLLKQAQSPAIVWAGHRTCAIDATRPGPGQRVNSIAQRQRAAVPRYPTASARCRGSMRDAPARSAIVRATLRTR